MRKFSEIDVGDVEIVVDPSEPATNEKSDETPDYLMNDCKWLGYEDSTIQNKMYWASVVGSIHGDNNKVLDVGCGRGDFGNFLLTMVNTDIEYTGIDLNEIAIDVGNKKYAHHIENESTKFTLEAGTWPYDFKDDVQYNWIFHNTNITLDYGVMGDDKYSYLEKMIESSLKMATNGVVFMLLNEGEYHQDDELIAEYIRFSYDGIFNILSKMNVKFAFDNTDFKNIFKLIIFNEPF